MVGGDASDPTQNAVVAWTDRGGAFFEDAVAGGAVEASRLGAEDLVHLHEEAAAKARRAVMAEQIASGSVVSVSAAGQPAC
jgi:hypothetical protein